MNLKVMKKSEIPVVPEVDVEGKTFTKTGSVIHSTAVIAENSFSLLNFIRKNYQLRLTRYYPLLKGWVLAITI